jgi:hypothetical protein
MTEPLNDAANNPQQTIAELQRKLAERNAERDELLKQQAATADVLKIISRSATKLKPPSRRLPRIRLPSQPSRDGL